MFLITLTLSPMLVLCSISLSIGATLYEGDTCRNFNPNGGSVGKCLTAYKCAWGLQQIQKGQQISTCNFIGRTPIICCPLNEIKADDNSSLNSTVTTPRSPVEYPTNLYDVQVSSGGKKEGKLSAAKCLEYYPRTESGGSTAVGGKKSLAEEFPHMALLGFGQTNDKQWKCGGSLISLQHVLTAAHCLNSRDFGNVKYVRLGDLDIAIDTDPAEPQDFNVKRAIAHPNYDARTVKNDIAVIELDRPIRLTKYVRPACLYAGGEIEPYQEITATGWGLTEFSGNPSSHLLKVKLKIIDKDDCQRQYLKVGPRGNIDDARQVCAGSADDKEIMDTCQGDSGGPLQALSIRSQMFYHIIGVTSFGKACGITKSAGIYTRVFFYLSWIESLVFQS